MAKNTSFLSQKLKMESKTNQIWILNCNQKNLDIKLPNLDIKCNYGIKKRFFFWGARIDKPHSRICRLDLVPATRCTTATW
jgi:hypothetical protein